MRWLCCLGILLATPAFSQTPGSKPPADVGALLAQADADWARRDEPGRMDSMRAALDKAEAAAPNDYGVLASSSGWRPAPTCSSITPTALVRRSSTPF